MKKIPKINTSTQSKQTNHHNKLRSRRLEVQQRQREEEQEERRRRRERRRRQSNSSNRRRSSQQTSQQQEDEDNITDEENILFPLTITSDEDDQSIHNNDDEEEDYDEDYEEEEDEEEEDDEDDEDDYIDLDRDNNNQLIRRTNRLLTIFRDWQDDDDNNKNLLRLLHAISENQSRKEGFIHRGITCNKCSVSPIRGIRYKCANCVDFDLCDMCEASNGHHHNHVFLKIRIPIPPLANPRSALLPPFYPGKNEIMTLSSEQANQLEAESHFDLVELEAIFAQYKSLSVVESINGGINQTTFEQCLGPLGMEKNLITERIFAFFDRDRDGIITFPELVHGLSVLCKGNLDEKIEYAFNGYDLDQDGYISREELYWMFKSYFYLSMELVRDVVSAMEDDMIDNYEFPAGQPVSAAFNVPIPSTSSSSISTDDNDDDNDNNNDEDYRQRNTFILRTATSSTQHRHQQQQQQKDKNTEYPEKNDYFTSIYKMKHDNDNNIDDDQPIHDNDDILLLNDNSSIIPNDDVNGDTTNGKIYEPSKQQWEEKFPIMETMAQDAIHEMVNKTFKNMVTEREGYISFDEFKKCVQRDSSIVNWFESLGTVF
ncbi:unnamed protein product [Cunninghamella echinulata]